MNGIRGFLMKLVSHETEPVYEPYPNNNRQCDVKYRDTPRVVNSAYFFSATPWTAEPRYPHSRDRVSVVFANGDETVHVLMWPREFKDTFGFSLFGKDGDRGER